MAVTRLDRPARSNRDPLDIAEKLKEFGAGPRSWALYARQLADELGMYDGGPAGRPAYLMGWRGAPSG